MSLKIEVFVPEDDVRNDNARAYVGQALSAIGFASVGVAAAPSVVRHATEAPAAEPEAPKTRKSRKASAPAPIEVPDDSPEAEAQDKADEVAEVEGAREPEKPLTKDDLRQVMGEYIKKYGDVVVQEDGAKLFAEALGTPPAGEKFWRLSLLPNDGDVILKAINTWKSAVEKNPYGRKTV